MQPDALTWCIPRMRARTWSGDVQRRVGLRSCPFVQWMTHLFVVVHAVVPAYIHASGAVVCYTWHYFREPRISTCIVVIDIVPRCAGLHCQLHLAVRSYLCLVLSVTPADEPHSSAVRRKVGEVSFSLLSKFSSIIDSNCFVPSWKKCCTLFFM